MSPRTLMVDHSHSEKNSCIFQIAPFSLRERTLVQFRLEFCFTNIIPRDLKAGKHVIYLRLFLVVKMSSTKVSLSLCYVTQVLNPDLACLIRAS